MNIFKLKLLQIILCLITTSSFANQIIVFTTQHYPITHAEMATQVYYLDQPLNIEKELSQALSKDVNIAQHQAKQLMQSSQWKKAEKRLKKSYQGVILGWKVGVRKVPAILFEDKNSQSVIYGIQDVQKALEIKRTAPEQ
ncbi:TIGR03757 family integrating conjugative element protein [Phocoenobacter skyensis]|uniref:TIGR03757 family integrating conjugative element protein n=1 Tax=Phocoenobacter skyensis TaxID=97481 RepID=UPI002766394F|nr:TIGR03757 family integrating conjugative element protein [Pasteurella skyensis]MDP8185345.1 TIGR03757 family integrating conjugative element protein [Pasteurella skyensis]